MLLYKFKSSRCSPCNQSTQRRRKVSHCWVSSSRIKRAKHETCNHTVELIIKMKTKFTSSNAEKTNGFISCENPETQVTYATQRKNPGVGSKGEKPNNTTKKKIFHSNTQSVSLKFQLLLQRTERKQQSLSLFPVLLL